MRRTPTILCLCLVACGGRSTSNGAAVISVDGSSTVFPISEAVAEEFKKQGDTRVAVGRSGTGGGFKKLCKREVAITGASRPIKLEEAELCKQGGVDYIELPVAYDGLAIVVHPAAEWVDYITVAELKILWASQAQGKIGRWSQVRAGWPDEEIHLFGAGVNSGTYDYFTQAIIGEEHSSRGDYTSSEDDNVLVQGIASDKHALGFFGFAYYRENASQLKLVPVDDGKADNGDGPVAPSIATVNDGTYQPLSRPIFVYVSRLEAERPEVAAFIDFYLDQSPALAEEVGYIPLPPATSAMVRSRFAARTLGSVFGGEGSTVGVRIEDLLHAG